MSAGYTPDADTLAALQFIGTVRPWGKTKSARAIGRYLDGDADALKAAPHVRSALDKAAATIREAVKP